MHSKIAVYFLSLKKEVPNRDYWDMTIVEDIFNGSMWNTGVEYDTYEVSRLEKKDRAIVVLPARHHKELESKVNDELKKLDHAVLFLMGDEEGDFRVEDIDHPSIHIWIQNPHPGRHDKYNKIGTGYSPHCKPVEFNKDLTVFFSGQITHSRRKEMIDAAQHYETGDEHSFINRTRGFTQGLEQAEYINYLSRSKVAPAPSGAVIPDSFRLYEALECMSIPIADEVNPTGTITEYWEWLFGEHVPFPLIKDWTSLTGYVNEALENWPNNMHQITAWWINKKRELAYKVAEQCEISRQ